MLTNPEPVNTRHLNWQGCYNVRDLGGLPTVDGGQTRWREVIRADLLGRLTSNGRQQLLDYGVRMIIDLRSPREVLENPSVMFPDLADAPTYLNLRQGQPDPAFRNRLRQAKTRAEVYKLLLDNDPTGNAAVMRAVAAAQPGGIIIHCHSGKDRTGIISALLLSLVGVPPIIVAEDYALSQERLWPLFETILEKAGGEIKDDPWLDPRVTPETIISMLNHIQAYYGGPQQYLEQGGFTKEEATQLKRRMLFEPSG